MPTRWEHAYITGASSGIGEAMARALPPATRLLLHGRDAARLGSVAEGLARQGRAVAVVAADLATEAGRQAAADAGRSCAIDLLVCNAGFGALGPHLQNDPAAETDMVAVNCMATVAISRALLPDMLARARASGRRCGMIVVASVAGFAPLPYFATYAATKAFDLFFAEAIAEELRDDPIDVLALCPGVTATRFFARTGNAEAARRLMAGGQGHSAARVARDALAALGRQRVLVVGAGNRLATLVPRLAPRRLWSAMAGVAMKRWRR